MKPLIYQIFFLFIFLSTMYGQEKMTLEKAISIGLENNFGVKIADSNIQIAQNNDTWARAGKVPIIDLNGNFSNNLVKDNNPASFLRGTYYNGSLGATLDAQWLVFAGGRVAVSKDLLAKSVDQQRLLKDADIHLLVKDIYQQYYAVLFNQAQLEVLQSSLALSQDRLVYEQTKRAFGNSNSFNLIQFENAIIGDSTNIVSQLQQVETAKRNLYNNLNIIGYANYDFDEPLNIVNEKIDEEKLKSILREENYTLKSLAMIASLDQLNTRLEQTARKPTVSVGASVGFSENGFQFFADDPGTGEPFPFLWSNRLNGGLNANLNWNLYDGGVRQTNIENARLQEQITQLNILEAQAQLNNQLDIFISNHENQRALLALADLQIQVSQKNLEMTEERFKAGQLSSLDFRNVQTQFLNAAFNKVNAIYNLILTKSEIDYLVGRFE